MRKTVIYKLLTSISEEARGIRTYAKSASDYTKLKKHLLSSIDKINALTTKMQDEIFD